MNTVDKKGRTPLYIAAMMGHIEAVKVLLQNQDVGVNIGRNGNGGTAFSIASEKSHFDVMEAMIANGKSNKGKGWCIDSWTDPCRRIEVTMSQATKVPPGEFLFSQLKRRRRRDPRLLSLSPQYRNV